MLYLLHSSLILVFHFQRNHPELIRGRHRFQEKLSTVQCLAATEVKYTETRDL